MVYFSCFAGNKALGTVNKRHLWLAVPGATKQLKRHQTAPRLNVFPVRSNKPWSGPTNHVVHKPRQTASQLSRKRNPSQLSPKKSWSLCDAEGAGKSYTVQSIPLLCNYHTLSSPVSLGPKIVEVQKLCWAVNYTG